MKASDEHGVIQLNGARGYAVGDKLKLIPGHCDPTVNLYDHFVCVRDGQGRGDLADHGARRGVVKR